jgi:hypothetical protein
MEAMEATTYKADKATIGSMEEMVMMSWLEDQVQISSTVDRGLDVVKDFNATEGDVYYRIAR